MTIPEWLGSLGVAFVAGLIVWWWGYRVGVRTASLTGSKDAP